MNIKSLNINAQVFYSKNAELTDRKKRPNVMHIKLNIMRTNPLSLP